jgi:uncharacterized membrane protein
MPLVVKVTGLVTSVYVSSLFKLSAGERNVLLHVLIQDTVEKDIVCVCVCVCVYAVLDKG